MLLTILCFNATYLTFLIFASIIHSKMSALELLQQINLVRLNDKLTWVEQNNAILKLIEERDSYMHNGMTVSSHNA